MTFSSHHEKLKALLASGKITAEQYEEMRGALMEALGESTPRTISGMALPAVCASEESVPVSRKQVQGIAGFLSGEWLVLLGTFLLMLMILLLFAPYTHQLDEIKTALLFFATPILLLARLREFDFSRFPWRSITPLLLIGLLIACEIVSLALNASRWATGEQTLWFNVACCTFALLLGWLVNDEKKLRTTMGFLMSLGLVACVIGILLDSKLTPIPEHLYRTTSSSSSAGSGASAWSALFYTLFTSREMYSTILNTSFFAVFLVMTLPVAMSVFLIARGSATKLVAAIAFILMNICIYATHSFGGMAVMLAVGYPVYFVLGFLCLKNADDGRGRRVQLLTVAVGALVFSATLLIPYVVKLSPTVPGALEGRRIMWGAGLLAWIYGTDPTQSSVNLHSLLFGNGPGGFVCLFPLFRRPDFFDYQINNVTSTGHNFYTDFLCEHGVAGFTALALLFGLLIRRGVKQILDPVEPLTHRLAQLALLTGFVGGAVASLFNPSIRWTVNGVMFWSVIGVSIAISRLRHGEQLAESRTSAARFFHPLLARTALVALTLVFVIRSTPHGILYYRAAVENNAGLKLMDEADVGTGGERTQDLRASIDRFEVAVRLNPAFATSYYKLGHIYNTMGEFDKSIDAYERLNRVLPHYSEIHLNLAIMYAVKAGTMKGDEKRQLLERSCVEWREAARESLKPNVQWLAAKSLEDLGNEFKTAGDSSKARPYFEQAREHYRNIVTYHPRLEELKRDREKYQQKAREAIARLDDVLKGPAQDDKTAGTVSGAGAGVNKS